MKKCAIIFCLVFVISIALVACFAFVPMSARQVAFADTSTIVSDTLYMFSNLALSDIDFAGSSYVSGPVTTYAMKLYSDYDWGVSITYNYCRVESVTVSGDTYSALNIVWYTVDPRNSNCNYFGYFSGTFASQNGFSTNGWYYGSFVYGNSYGNRYTSKTAYPSSSYDNDNEGFVFLSDFTIPSGNVMNVLYQFLTPAPVSHVPVLGSVYTSELHYRIFDDTDEPFFNDTRLYYYYKIDNASEYASNTGVVNVTVYYHYTDNTSYSKTIALSRFGVDYYICLFLPYIITLDGVNIPSKVCDYVHLYFSGYAAEYLVFSSSENSSAFNNFRYNYRSFASVCMNGGSYNAGYLRGFNAGLEAGAESVEGNTLFSVIWAVFEMPFKILFGSYDNDSNSPTYHQYVGGLFNFTLLGIDLRPFILSIMSVCIVIGVLRIILGFKTGGR